MTVLLAMELPRGQLETLLGPQAALTSSMYLRKWGIFETCCREHQAHHLMFGPCDLQNVS